MMCCSTCACYYVSMDRSPSLQIPLACLAVLCLPLPAYAVNAPKWVEFSSGEYIDTANIKSSGNMTSAYIKTAKQGPILYEVDCEGDKIRVHSDLPRYISVPVKGGGSVVQLDDGFRTVIPGGSNARIENAICKSSAQQEAQVEQQRQQADCEKAKGNETLRVLLVKDRLSADESMCLIGLTHDTRYSECDKVGVPLHTSVTDYLHHKGILLRCEMPTGAR